MGAGASGINMAYQIKKHMRNVEHVVYEKNPSVGGTWFENRYPGCKCDIREFCLSLAARSMLKSCSLPKLPIRMEF